MSQFGDVVHLCQNSWRCLMNKQTKLTQRLILCVLIPILLLAIGLAGCRATPTPEPTATPTLMATATPKPTPTPPPTATPTSEPTPTDTPIPIPTPSPTLSPPEAPMTEPGGEITVEPGKKVAVRASAAGANQYQWTLQGDGRISDTQGDAILYTAPEQGDTIAILTVTAHNDGGASPPTSLVINVLPIAAATVPLDALAIPAGWMSGGTSPANFISLERGNEAICHTGADCLRISYRPGGVWGGIYWWPLGCGESGTEEAWDQVRQGTCGINVLEAGNLTAANRLTFWAKGDQGGEVVEFKIGAVDILPSPGRSLGRVTLTGTWEQYEIDLEGMDLTNAIGLFLWVASDVDNPEGTVFYLDDIQFEGVK